MVDIAWVAFMVLLVVTDWQVYQEVLLAVTGCLLAVVLWQYSLLLDRADLLDYYRAMGKHWQANSGRNFMLSASMAIPPDLDGEEELHKMAKVLHKNVLEQVAPYIQVGCDKQGKRLTSYVEVCVTDEGNLLPDLAPLPKPGTGSKEVVH